MAIAGTRRKKTGVDNNNCSFPYKIVLLSAKNVPAAAEFEGSGILRRVTSGAAAHSKPEVKASA